MGAGKDGVNTSGLAEDQLVVQSRQGATGVLTLNRPAKKNALTRALLDQLAQRVSAASEDPSIRVVVITGAGGAFSSGADLAEAVDVVTAEEARHHLDHFRRANDAIEQSPLPVVAAIDGPCFTGGLELALCCDLRIGGDASTFAMTSARIGGLAAAGGTQRLPRLIGVAKAKELMMLAQRFDARTAYDIGLLNRLVPSGEALGESLKVAEQLADAAPISLAMLKQAIREGMALPLPAALELEASLGSAVFETQDRVEGMRAFLEHRPPRFTGR